jgi:putative phosphoesterase
MTEKNIGVISDTHGLLRPEVLDIFENMDLIIHAGDVGNEEILEELKRIAPVIAVRGNTDKGFLARKLNCSEIVDIGDKSIYLIHDIEDIEIEPEAAFIDIVVYGHSHKQDMNKVDEVLYLNPGSAGPKRFKLPTSVAVIKIIDDEVKVEFVEI